jgi:hypothetical protein
MEYRSGYPWPIGDVEQLKGAGRRFADETTAPVFDRGRGRTKNGQLCLSSPPRWPVSLGPSF